MLMQTPDRSLQQRREALARANRVRAYRARLKVEMKRGERSLRPLLLSPPAELVSMRVFDLLVAVPKVGRVKAGRVLRQAGVSPSRTVGGLSARQRSELLLRLGPWAG